MKTLEKIFFLILVFVLWAAFTTIVYAGEKSTYRIERVAEKDISAYCSYRMGLKTVRKTIAACTYQIGIDAFIVVLPAEYWNECSYRHELAHVLYGDWHAGRESSECSP